MSVKLKGRKGFEESCVPVSTGESDLELTGDAHEVAGDHKVNCGGGQKGTVLGIGKSDVFEYIKGLG